MQKADFRRERDFADQMTAIQPNFIGVFSCCFYKRACVALVIPNISGWKAGAKRKRGLNFRKINICS